MIGFILKARLIHLDDLLALWDKLTDFRAKASSTTVELRGGKWNPFSDLDKFDHDVREAIRILREPNSERIFLSLEPYTGDDLEKIRDLIRESPNVEWQEWSTDRVDLKVTSA